MATLYSPITNSFYDTAIEYPSLPHDVYEITDEEYHYVMKRVHEHGETVTFRDGKLMTVRVEVPLTWEQIRTKRQRLLAKSDHTDLLSFKAREGKKVYDAWQKYRQELRDITANFETPDSVVWPEPPASK